MAPGDFSRLTDGLAAFKPYEDLLRVSVDTVLASSVCVIVKASVDCGTERRLVQLGWYRMWAPDGDRWDFTVDRE